MKRYCVLFALIQLSCAADTGSGLIQFEAYAGGQDRSRDGGPYEFDTAAGYHVVLTSAKIHIGAVYLNRAKPILGAQDTSCILNGTYTGEVRSPVDVDALSSALEPFPDLGDGTLDRALTGEVWLTGGEIDAENDATRILKFSGAASKNSRTYGFYGKITIGQNRAVSSSDPSTPSANPLCKQRIVTPIRVDLQPTLDGHLEVRVKPNVSFDNVEFSKIDGAIGDGEESEITDSSDDDVSTQLLQGLRATEAYQFYWQR